MARSALSAFDLFPYNIQPIPQRYLYIAAADIREERDHRIQSHSELVTQEFGALLQRRLEVSMKTTNLLLQSLPLRDLSNMLAATDVVQLSENEILYESSNQPKYAYFVTDGVASVVTSLRRGQLVEVGIIGREGLTGALHLMGDLQVPTQCHMRIAGNGRRLLLSDLKTILLESVVLRQRLMEFIQFLTISARQLTTCNAIHTMEQRLARWLLNVQDRMPGQRYSLTQEFLSGLLGAHHPAIALGAAQLQQQGIIHYLDGRVEILDQQKLESLSCECHAISLELLRNLYSVQQGDSHEGDSHAVSKIHSRAKHS